MASHWSCFYGSINNSVGPYNINPNSDPLLFLGVNKRMVWLIREVKTCCGENIRKHCKSLIQALVAFAPKVECPLGSASMFGIEKY